MSERRTDQSNPLAETIGRLDNAALIIDSWDFMDRVDIHLQIFGGYPSQIVLDDTELEKLELEIGIETGVDSADVLRLDRWGKNSLWRQEKFGDGYRPVSEVGSAELSQNAGDIIWILTDKEDKDRAIAANAPEGANAYWVCGPEVNLLGSQTDHSDEPGFALQPVQYFTVEEPDYEAGDEFFYTRAQLDKTAAGVARHTSTQIPILEQLEAEGVDSTKFAHYLPAGTTRAQYLAKTAILRRNHRVLEEAVAEARATEHGKGARNPNQALRKVADIAVDFDPERAAEIARSIEDDGVAAKTLTSIGVNQQNSSLFTEARDRIVAGFRGTRQENELFSLFRATYQVDPVFAESLLDDMRKIKNKDDARLLLAEHQAELESTQRAPDPDIAISTELLTKLTPERLGEFALLLAEQHRETGDIEFIAASLSVAGLIGELEARQAALANVATVMSETHRSRNR
jgi:hypothetical protein